MGKQDKARRREAKYAIKSAEKVRGDARRYKSACGYIRETYNHWPKELMDEDDAQ